jgi:hypothetical protein
MNYNTFVPFRGVALRTEICRSLESYVKKTEVYGALWPDVGLI